MTNESYIELDEGYHPLPLLKKVCEKIIHDHSIIKDWSVIDELFKDHTTTDLEDFVSKEIS